MSQDVIGLGAGVSGLVTACLLAEQGQRVLLLEKHGHLGGRAREYRYRGHQIGLGSHLVEDPGDSLTRVCAVLGHELEHSRRSDSMPFWTNGKGWAPIQEQYSGAAKAGLKRCIRALADTPYSELENWNHASLREWMAQHTSDEGVYTVWEAISVLEQITLRPHEHSASENLFTRKMHYEARRTAGYSFWPMGGWDALWHAMVERFQALGGELRLSTPVSRVRVHDGAVRGVRLRSLDGGPAEEIDADRVVVSAPVWDLPRLFDSGALPWDLLARIRMLADNRNRACWIGYWIAAEEPVIAMTEREMASFLSTPRCGLPGFTLNFTGYDPSVSPTGEYLTCVGASFDATERYGDRPWIDRKFAELWDDIEEMMPAARGALWTKPHVVNNYGVINKPGLVGPVRPDTEVRGVEGLWLTGDTTRSRGIGIDKAARAGITTAESVLGRRLPAFAGTVRY
ncbi:phytoene dehydrogenase-like protein [Pseudonocardia sediminis]|uniref:Phytoene dehydrogenase-like protein n=1 Tax=Pseudonocardia sediminis TaxID=1397368 RepID=A0A4Q7URY1_PSEST|nr:FAD-dependent oxidoreductase [Pseudonocardia sediminis]RZT84502.1 phytoene dehydrogenase-like protein [Pseudonocardia sediminis]